MRCLVNTNYKESIAFLDTSLIIWMFIFFIIPSVFLIKKRKWMIQEFGKRIKISLIVIFIGVGLFYSPLIFMKNPPYRFLQEMIDTDLYPSNLIRILKKWHGVHYNADSGIKRDICEGRKLQFDDKGVKLILVIGESVRSDRFGINGYNRNTTPNLAKISKHNENSIISVLKNLGFKTYWLSAQPSTYEVDDLAYESDVVIPKQKYQIVR